MVDERVLLEGARQFDEKALAEIYDLYSPGIYGYAMRLAGNPDLAEECVAETFSRLLSALKRGKGPRNYLRAYLYRIAHNWITDSYRRQPPAPEELDADLPWHDGEEPSQNLASEMQRQEVREALGRLTPDQRMVIALKFLEDWKNEEIARALEKPVGAVKALQHRGLKALRRLLVDEEEIL